MSQSLYVINLEGKKELFSRRKIFRSAKNAGAPNEVAQEIAEEIGGRVYQGMKTSEIFRQIKSLLKKKAPTASLRFNLKEGMRKLGPTGFIFEKYVAEIFSTAGFFVKINQIIPGLCCNHEIDFLAEDSESLIFGECKYRNLGGGKVDLPIALQNYARFLDIRNGPFLEEGRIKGKKARTMLVTNEKFTIEAINYSRCMETELLGWKYPKRGGLERLIEKNSLYPITILPSFKRHLSQIFVAKNLNFVKDIFDLDLERFGEKNKIPLAYLKKLKREAEILMAGHLFRNS